MYLHGTLIRSLNTPHVSKTTEQNHCNDQLEHDYISRLKHIVPQSVFPYIIHTYRYPAAR